MPFIRILLATVLAVTFAGASASAGQKQKPPQKRVIILDRSMYGPPPPPHERRYVGPAPALGTPMAPVPRVAPLAQPPVR